MANKNELLSDVLLARKMSMSRTLELKRLKDVEKSSRAKVAGANGINRREVFQNGRRYQCYSEGNTLCYTNQGKESRSNDLGR